MAVAGTVLMLLPIVVACLPALLPAPLWLSYIAVPLTIAGLVLVIRSAAPRPGGGHR